MKRISRIYVFSFVVLILIGSSGFEICKSRSFQFFGRIIHKVETDQKIIALTFDDGPTQNLDTVLQILKKYHVPATFFFTGNEMAINPELTKKAINEGHN